jgi:hypothetical protein
MHKNAMKCNKTQSKWCINNYGASKIIDMFETYHTPVPKGFKLPHDQQKYDGSQEPSSWLSDYLQAAEYLEDQRKQQREVYNSTSPA